MYAVIMVVFMWTLYLSRGFISFQYIRQLNNKRRILLELPNQNITLNITFREPVITLPRIYLDDAHQIIMLFQ